MSGHGADMSRLMDYTRVRTSTSQPRTSHLIGSLLRTSGVNSFGKRWFSYQILLFCPVPWPL
ncbi:hypothetical protein PISMIDRAFT_685539 [Pisolithus microcarpus 441]|uniref:Uncharacterized protein n=1 Tax=Pisolithus microcarpus 441 TaxID=765257 RepID=A0A0C9Z412_9AGAM|nr:hypothetical protein PISMIDRAFT_685539 [Pisolithus microcarpus 441]